MNFKEIGIPTIKLFAIATAVTILLFLTIDRLFFILTADVREIGSSVQTSLVVRKRVWPEYSPWSGQESSVS